MSTPAADSLSPPASDALLRRWPRQRVEKTLRWLFGGELLLRFLYPFFNSPLSHLWSDPARHWENGQQLFHPGFMGSGDPLMYQLWLHLLQQIKGNQAAVIPAGCGLLCAAMPYGWYRALKELLPRDWALGGALLMGLVPGFYGIYGYFMNETLLLTLTGFAFWATFRAQRKRSVGAFAVACALWLLAGFTRTTALPMGLLCLLAIWLPQPRKLLKAAVGVPLLLALAIPASLHTHSFLGFYSPFGNAYLGQIYEGSGKRNIHIGMDGGYWQFGSPSFYNPSFYPFSNWTTDRDGMVSINIDTKRGRESWVEEKDRTRAERDFPVWRGYWENLIYLGFAQSWPDNDPGMVIGWLTIWTRWLWPPLILLVGFGAVRGQFSGRQWLLPASGLGLILFLLMQQQGVMEGRYRKPIDPLFVASAVLMLHRKRTHPQARSAVTFEPLAAAFGPAAPIGQFLIYGEPRPVVTTTTATTQAAPRRRWRVLGRHAARVLGALLAMAVALWLVLPRISAVEHISTGLSGPVTLPWVFTEVSDGNRLEVHLHGTWLTPGRWTIVPDDRLTSLTVNGQNVPLDHVRPGGLSDYRRGFDIDLSPWLRNGDNDLELMVDNTGWNGGIALRPWLGWRWLLLIAGFVPWLLLLARGFRLHRVQSAILVASLVPLCVYLAGTPWNVHAHDVTGYGGHFDHIVYIATHLLLPAPNAGWTYYHPPLYYVTAAAVYRWAHWLGLSVTDSLQFLALAFYLVFLTATAGALRLVLSGRRRLGLPSLALATAALALWPGAYMHGLTIGNDAAFYAMAAVTAWFTLRWWRSGRRSHLIGMALFIALAFLTKSNAMVLAAAAVALLGLRLLHHPRRPGLRLDALLLLGLIGLGAALSLGNQLYFHWRGEMPDWLIGNAQSLPAGLRVPVSLGAFTPLDVPTFLSAPWLDSYNDATGRGNFWNYLLRSALSGEFSFDSDLQRFIAYVWGGLLLWLLWLLLLPRRSLAWTRRGAWRDAPLILFSLLWLASLAALRIGTPYACSNDFRYILPILLPLIVAAVRGGRLTSGLLLALGLGSLPFVMAL